MTSKGDKPEWDEDLQMAIRKGWLTQQQVASSLEITVKAFNDWLISPRDRINRKKYYTVRDVLDNRIEHEKQKIEQKFAAKFAEEDSIAFQELRLTKARAQQLEIKNAVAEGKLVPIELITVILSEMSGEMAGYLDTIPQKLKRKYPELETQMIEAVKWHIVKAMNNIADLGETVERVIDDYNAGQETYKAD